MVLGNFGQHAKAQQFYVTFISTYFGLSRAGVMTMGNLGLGCTKTFFDNTKASILLRFDERIRYHALHFAAPFLLFLELRKFAFRILFFSLLVVTREFLFEFDY